jgi:hypothetical protein
VVPDPERAISLAYGVTIWPTTIFLDPNGFIENIRYGLISGQTKPVPHGRKRRSK